MNKFGQTANSEYKLKKKLELTAFELDTLPGGFYSKLIDKQENLFKKKIKLVCEHYILVIEIGYVFLTKQCENIYSHADIF